MQNLKTARAEESFYSGLLPDPILTVSEWSDSYRMLSQRASAEPGKWRTSRTPYLKEIMDCLSSLNPVQEVVFMKGAQVGGSECGFNWIAYVIDYAPAPMMMVLPTVELAKRGSKQRIAPLIEESPRLKEKVKDARSRDSGNTLLAKEFPGGLLVMTGANSAVGLRSLPARYLFLDEIDAYPGDVDGEGDPVNLAEARTRTFARRKWFKVSTPTVGGRSRIEASYENSDKRKYFVPCPHCKEAQVLKWAQLKWEEKKPDTVRYICEFCRGEIDEHHKTWMLENGRWVAENPGVRGGRVAGFHINSLYSPVGWFSWRDAVELFLKSKGNSAMLRGFVNTCLGETWKEKGDAPDWKRIYERREQYALNIIPKQALFITAGADVQKDRIEAEIVAWGRDKQSWSIDKRVFHGDTATDEPWRKLNELLNEEWPHEGGLALQIKTLAVDSGYNTQHVYSWARQHSIMRVIVVKGVEGQNTALGHPKAMDINIRGKNIKRGARLWTVGTNLLKDELYSWLKLDKPIDGDPYPSGYCHFPEYEDEYFKQLTAEQLFARTVKGYTRYQWEKTRERNEALDMRVYARAAAIAFGIDRFNDKQWARMADELGISLESKKSPLSQTPSSNKTKPPSATSEQKANPKLRKKKSNFW